MAKSLKLSDGYLLHVLLFVIAIILIYHFVFGNKKDGFFGKKAEACTKDNGEPMRDGKTCFYRERGSQRLIESSCEDGICR